MSRYKKHILSFLSLLCSTSMQGAPTSPLKGHDPSIESIRIELRHIENKGVGYKTGYTTLEGFFAPSADKWSVMPFVDLRGHVFDDGKFAANAGFGFRTLAGCRLYGANVYYDYRNTKRQHYNQVGLGFETLGVRWDFRLNGYLPVGKKTSSPYDIHTNTTTAFDSFQGNNALLRQTTTTKSKVQYAMKGIDAEVAYHILKKKNIDFYAAAGPYYYGYNNKQAVGGKARLSAQIFKYLSLDLINSYDSRFHENIQGSVSINVPFGPRLKPSETTRMSKCKDYYYLAQRLVQDVDRQEIVVVDRYHQTQIQDPVSVAINPLTGAPYNFLFVNNTSHSLGTYESPYNSLAIAEAASSPNDILYIYPGDGTTTGLNAGITLKDYQRLWGSGIDQTLPTTLGTIQIPTQSAGTLNGLVYNPIITNTGTVVTLANGNEISGLFLENTISTSAIAGSNIRNATVSNCTIAGANTQGSIGFSATELEGILTINNCMLNQNNAINLSNSTTNLEVNISDSNLAGGDVSSTSSISWALSNAAEGVLTATNNIFNSSYTAITVTPNNTSSIAATINNSSITTGGYGVYVNGSGTGAQNINVDGNTMNTYYEAIWIADAGLLTANIANNTINASESYSVKIDTSNGTASVVMNDNFINSQQVHTVYLNHSGGSFSATLNGNMIYAGDGQYAIYSNLTGTAVNHTLNLNGNTLTGYSGWHLDQTVGTDVTSTWNNNTVSSIEESIKVAQATGNSSLTLNNNNFVPINEYAAISWTTSGTAINTNISMTGNQAAGFYGLYCTQPVGNLTLSLTDNSLPSYYPVYLTLGTPGTTTATLSENACSGYFGIYVEQSAGTFNATVNNNTIASVGSYGYYYNIIGGSPNTTQVVSGNTITSGPYGNYAVDLYSQTTGTTSFTVTDNILSGGGGSSSSPSVVCAMSGGTQSLNLSNNTMTNSGGFSLSATNTTAATWDVNGNQFFASGSTPVVASTANTSTVCMQLNDNTAYPTTGAYSLTNGSSGAFHLNPPQGNIGELTLTGSITETKCP